MALLDAVPSEDATGLSDQGERRGREIAKGNCVIEPMESSHINSRIGHSENSSLREQALGHLFLGELLAEMWRRNRWDI